MKFYKNILILFALATLAFSSCQEEEEPHHENSATVTVESPLDDAEFGYGETVHIHGVAKGEMTLHGYSVKIETESGEELFHADKHDHNVELTIEEEWVNNVSETGFVFIAIDVALDHEGTIQSKVIKVLCHAAS